MRFYVSAKVYLENIKEVERLKKSYDADIAVLIQDRDTAIRCLEICQDKKFDSKVNYEMSKLSGIKN
jgi:hypothetical protein